MFPSVQKAEKLLLNKPNIILDQEWNKFKSIINNYINLIKKYSDLDLLISKINDLVNYEKLNDDQGNISDSHWEKLKKIETEIIKSSIETKKKLAQFKKLDKELTPLKLKLEKQLKIISELFINPASISRVETYSNPFSAGNFENLVLLGKRLEDFKNDDLEKSNAKKSNEI